MVNYAASNEIYNIINKMNETKSWLPSQGLAFSYFGTQAVLFDRLETSRLPMRKSWTDGPRDGGFDGICITIKKQPITSVDDIPSFSSYGKQVKVKFVFIQSKLKSNFNSNDWKAFFSSITAFFSNKIDRSLVNPQVRNFLEILDALKELKKYYNLKFVVHAVIVSMPEKLINLEIENYQEVLQETLLYLGVADSVKFHYYGANRLLALYHTRGYLISQEKSERRYSSRGYRIVA